MKNNISDYKNIFWFLTVGVFVSLSLYAYFVSHTVWSVVERQKSEKTILSLENNIEKLESDYLALKSKVTVDLALEKGFSEVSASVKFISRKPLSKGLTLNNEI